MEVASPDAALETLAVVLEKPGQLGLRRLGLSPPTDADVVVDLDWTGISAGTERLLFTGRMPLFPGMGYPLVPGYEAVGRIVQAGSSSGRRVGEQVFVPGARCFQGARGLFGGAAERVVVPGARAVPVSEDLGERATLLALAATAHHIISAPGARPPELIVGHGALGRLVARLTMLRGEPAPTVWESNEARRPDDVPYPVVDPESDSRTDYGSICDVSGDASLLDALIARLSHGGEIMLAGFYSDRVSFSFPSAFAREPAIRIAAEWAPSDLESVLKLVESGRLDLDGLITHRQPACDAAQAYETAFSDSTCLKMVVDWSHRE